MNGNKKDADVRTVSVQRCGFMTVIRMEGLTTPKQIRFLENRGFLHVGTQQFDAAKRLIDRIAGNGWQIPRGIVPAEYVPEVV